MGKKKFYYAVQKGHNQGVYNTWNECKEMVDGFKNAKFRKFETQEEAQAFASGSSYSSSSSSSAARYAPPVYSNRKRGAYDDNDSYSRAPQRRRLDSPPSISSDTSSSPTRYAGYAHESSSLYLRSGIARLVPSPPPVSDAQIVYTDGAASGNGRSHAKAGYGVFWGDNDPRNESAPLAGDRQTNQRAEATAILRVLETTQGMDDTLEIRTDSQYCIKAMTEWHHNWVKKKWVTSTGEPVQNRDLFEPMLNLVKSRKGTTKFTYVPGHRGVYGNEMADRLAVAGARKPTPSSP